jgi:hypothetical protein
VMFLNESRVMGKVEDVACACGSEQVLFPSGGSFFREFVDCGKPLKTLLVEPLNLQISTMLRTSPRIIN